jgi:serine/threonine protein phosphatase PrpC
LRLRKVVIDDKVENKFMVIASDGLWEFISNEEVMELVVPAFVRNDAEEAVEVLQRKAVEAWVREDENIDDITIIVVFFKYY